ncbi:hypothetical protein GCM10010112_12560 [Actinoplanes lobatus]|uniref:Uncharacterized protein n=1 Tax=Actinoplanes lobatus TaxID=113568 RepID=A0ABQ4AA77_9ACTN|nr:hypothetical protein GCM10010112_12560 [Actinoplanes lobatus]GIE37379.1 hypothetical protein Alo02nite_02770 [Actinoplanes lobatus]
MDGVGRTRWRQPPGKSPRPAGGGSGNTRFPRRRTACSVGAVSIALSASPRQDIHPEGGPDPGAVRFPWTSRGRLPRRNSERGDRPEPAAPFIPPVWYRARPWDPPITNDAACF